MGGRELARVTVVGPDLETVFEKVVKPDHRIIDYNTRYGTMSSLSEPSFLSELSMNYICCGGRLPLTGRTSTYLSNSCAYCGTEEYLEDKEDQQQNKDPPVQEQRPKCATICGGIMESYQRHMPDAGSFPKQVPEEDTANLLAKQNLQHGSP